LIRQLSGHTRNVYSCVLIKQVKIMACAQHGSARNDCCRFSFIFSRKLMVIFSLLFHVFPPVCVCVFLGVVVVRLLYYFFLLTSSILFFFLFFSTFFFSLFKITRPQVVSDRVKADWRKLFLLNYLSSSDIGCSTFSEGLLLLLLLPFG
jgi:hypothetical protein